jgi:hypothetical protein
MIVDPHDEDVIQDDDYETPYGDIDVYQYGE